MAETITEPGADKENVISENPRTPGTTRGFGVFRNRNFRLLWTGAVASNIGTWMQGVAQGWLIITLTNSPGWLGAVALANSIPFLILPLFGGVLADRVDRVRLLKITQSFSMLLAFTLAALTLSGVIQVWQILLLAFLNATSNSFDQPTRNALLPDLVGPNELMQAVSLNSTAYQGAALVGPAIAGILVGIIGVGGCFLINGLSFFFVLLALYLMKVPRMEARTRRPVAHDLLEGLAYLRRSPILLTVLLLTCLFSIFGRSYSTLLPAFARLVLHTNSQTLGLMYAMPGLGTLLGGFALAAYGDVRRKGTFLTAMALMTGTTVFVFAVSSSVLLILPILIGIGIANTAYNATVSTVLQTRAPANMRGRVMSYNTVAWRGLTPAGGAVVGLLAELFGTRTAMASGGIVVVIAAVSLYLLVPHIRSADRDAEVVRR